ncbi:MAG: cobalamin-binding protein [Alkalicoccus sp.]|nr:MAG: cobalamin-binding protein [Alkalicoccus sp.]
MKIVSICPSNTELLAYAGLIDSVAGVDDFSDWPESIQHLPRLGPDLDINMNKLEDLKPDLVYASLSVPGMEKNIEQLKERNIPYTIVENPETLSDIGNILENMCREAGNPEKGRELKEAFLLFIAKYRRLSSQVEYKKRIYWEWWPKPIFTPGKKNWLTEMGELAGAVNIFSDVDQASVQTTWEEVLNRNPEYILAAWVGVRKNKVNPKVIRKRPGWSEMKAVREDQIHILEEPYYCRPSPRLLIGLAEAAYLLHPDIFPEPDGKEDRILNI